MGLQNQNSLTRLQGIMITTTRKSLLLFLVFTLVITPVSMVFSNPISDSNVVVSKKECHKKQSASHSKQMQMDKMSSGHTDMVHEKCTCKMGCNHAQCTSGCSDCSHCVLGLVSRISQPPVTHPSQISLISQTLYQKPFVMQYRPPKHS